MSQQVDALRTRLVVIRATTLSLSVSAGESHGSRGKTTARPPALLVPRRCGFADPIAYGIDDYGTEGRMAIGAGAIPAALRIRLGDNLP